VKARYSACLLVFLLISVPRPGVPDGPGPAAGDDQKAQLYQHYDDVFKVLLSQATKQMSKEVLKYESLMPGLLPKKVTVRGSHYEFGYLVGLIAREAGQNLNRRTEADAEINRRIAAMYRDICPLYLEKTRGIAAAYGMSLDDVDLRSLEYDFEAKLWWDLFKYSQFNDLTKFSEPVTQCSMISYYLESERKHLVGRNFDNPADRPVFLVASSLDGVYRSIGDSVYQLHQWMPDGINEKGLFVGVASVVDPPKYAAYKDTAAYPDKPSIQAVHLLRIILDSCATVDEALELIRKVNVWFPVEMNHFMIADSQGHSVVVEFDQNKNLLAFHRQSPFLVLTNTALQEGTAYAYNSCWRYKTATDMLSKGISSLGGLGQVVGAIQFRSGPTRTLWSLLADLAKKEFIVAYLADNFMSLHQFDFAGPMLTWAQLALGGGYECTMLISNQSDAAWSGRVSLKEGNNEQWSGPWKFNGQEGTGTGGFNIAIAPKGTIKVRLSGDSATRSGYLQMQGAEPSSVVDLAVSYFYNYLVNGRLTESVGSSAGDPGRTFSFPVEKTASVNTGFAWAPASVTTPFPIALTLYDANGNEVDKRTITYTGHEARFFDQVFNSVPFGYLGRIQVDSQELIHFEVLRLDQTEAGFQLTSTPPHRIP
jgi:predicted choloylglycine hydrolase